MPTSPGHSGAGVNEGWMVAGWRDEEIGPRLTAKAVEFIERTHEEAPAQPFFLYFASQAAHQPCTPPEFIKGRSEAGERGDMVAEFDWSVGQIMKTLERLRITGDTLLLVTSDNGAERESDDGRDYGHKSCGGLRGYKGRLYEGGHRVPFVARWPGKIKPGAVKDQLICLSDLMATGARIAGARLPEDAAEDSVDMLPTLVGDSGAGRDAIVHHDFGGRFAIRRGAWKLLLRNTVELYNLEEDLGEQNNVAMDHAEIVDELKNLLEEYKNQGHSRG